MIWPYLHVAETNAHMYRAILSQGSHANNVLWQLILVWSPGRGSAIHDHANAHCVMKVSLATRLHLARGEIAELMTP